MENKYTQRAQNALVLAATQAQRLGHTYIGSEHLLLGLIEERDGIASKLLQKKGLSLEKAKRDILAQTSVGERTALSSKDLTPRVRKIVESASSLAAKHKQNLAGTEHILYCLLSEGDCLAVRIIEQNGIYAHELQGDIISLIQSGGGISRGAESKKRDERGSALSLYGRDMIALAIGGRLDPTLCRERETERLIQILSRRKKNNPCLIGEPGVGKTAVVEGLAKRIAEGDVPPILKSKRIYSLDLPSLIAGAKYRGEFEDRMKSVMRECYSDPSIILFIDEIHTIIGAGGAEGAIDAANILKPALSRGEIQVIGATTVSEYRRHIEKDSALERRFQPISVNEPSAEETERILHGLRARYEEHHGISITNDAIRASIELSQRYINDRFLPDKAIDLIDEACSRVRLRLYSQKNERRLLEKKLCAVASKKEEAIIVNDLSLARELHREELALDERISSLGDVIPSPLDELPSVTGEDVAEVVTEWSGIPVSRLLEGEGDRLLELEERLKERIIGQDDAIEVLSRAIRRGRLGLKRAEQPVGSFIFVGPTGVGKTELCIALAEILFGSRSSIIRLDMSEYMEKHSVGKLIGAPPGYVGYGEGGFLTEKVRSKPYSIVLFDEIEKAHPEIFNILLQILEDGSLRDSQGRFVDFKNTLIIMTSNLGAGDSQTPLGFFRDRDGATIKKESERQIKKALDATFSPEFIGRVDEIVIFNALSRSDIEGICRIMLASLSERLEKLSVYITFDESVVNAVVDSSLDGRSGARRLRREIRRLIEDPISNAILTKEIGKNSIVCASFQDSKLIFK